MNGGAGVEAEALERARSLDGDQCVLVRGVSHLGAACLPVLQPRVRGVAVAGVDDEQVVAVTHPVDDEVVDDPAALVREQRVLGLAVADPVEVVREERLEELRARGPLDVQLSHVRDVERARRRRGQRDARE